MNWTHYHDYLRKKKITYREYLLSKHWRNLRLRFYRRNKNRVYCSRCKRKNIQLHLHHKTYIRLGKERLLDLELLCKYCHRQEHKRTKVNLVRGVWGILSKIKIR